MVAVNVRHEEDQQHQQEPDCMFMPIVLSAFLCLTEDTILTYVVMASVMGSCILLLFIALHIVTSRKGTQR